MSDNHEPKFSGLCIKRPFASDQQTRESVPLCGGDRFATYVAVTEGEELPHKFPFEAYCLNCLAIHKGVSVDEAAGDAEQPILG